MGWRHCKNLGGTASVAIPEAEEMKHFRKVGEPFWDNGKRMQKYVFAPEPDIQPEEIPVVTYPDGTEQVMQTGEAWELLLEDTTGEFN